jgi:MFS family permease
MHLTKIAMRSRGGLWLLIAICAAVFCDTLLYDIIVPFLPEHLSTETTSSTLATSWVISLYAIAFLLAQPIARKIYQRYGPLCCLLVGITGMLIAALLPLIQVGMIVFFCSRIIHGAAGAVLFTASFSVVASRFAATDSSKRGMAFSLLTTMASLGILVGPPLGGLLYEQVGLFAPFLAVAAILLVAMALCFQDRRAIPAIKPETRQLSWRESHERFASTTYCVAWGSAALSLLDVALPVELMEQWDFSPGTIGVIIGAAVVVYGVAASLSGWLSGRANRQTLMTFGMLVCALALSLLALTQSVIRQTLILAGFASGCAFLLNPACDELATQAELSGTGYEHAFGWFNVAYAVGNILGPLSYGLIKHFAGMNSALFVISLSAVLVWRMMRKRTIQKTSLQTADKTFAKAA